MTAPERFADSQIPLAPRAPSIHDPKATWADPRVYLQGNTENHSPLQCNIGIVPTDDLVFAPVNREIVEF
jgi:hypothetical protein